MKIISACSMILFLTAMPVFAKQQLSHDEMAAKMQSKLNLTPDQMAAVKPIFAKYASKRKALRQSIQNGGDRSSIRNQMKQLRADENQELSQFLSQEQMAQFKHMQSQAMHRLMEKRKDGQAGGARGAGGMGGDSGGLN